MKNILHHAIITIKKQKYLSLLMILAPLLNFLSGITFDLHAPSLPAIAKYFNASISSTKNTISISLLGFSLGCILFGTLMDIFGRRPIILLSLFLYTFASFLAPFCHTINELLFIRFLQGFVVSCIAIGCRTILIDNFSGHQFKIALLYTSLAFGVGPIIAPFVGGYLQYQFGWQANFIAYGITSFILLIMFMIYIVESTPSKEPFSVKNILFNYIYIFKQYSFILGTIIIGLSQIQLFIYTTIGAFLVENRLHYSAIIYGNSALIVSCGYLVGTLINRLLLKYLKIFTLIGIGFFILFISVFIQIFFSIFFHMNLFTLIFPITLIQFSNGFIFINVFACCIRSTTKAGMATALFTFTTMVLTTAGIYFINQFNIYYLSQLSLIFAITTIIQFIGFLIFINKIDPID